MTEASNMSMCLLLKSIENESRVHPMSVCIVSCGQCRASNLTWAHWCLWVHESQSDYLQVCSLPLLKGHC